MNRNKKGFTLVELLAVIVVLAVILAIAIPNVLGIIDNARKDSFASTAKMMIEAAKTVATSKAQYVPSATGYGRIIPWDVLSLDNATKDADGGSYTTAECYVVVVNQSGTLRYFVTLKGSKRSVDRKEATTIVVDSDTTVTATVVGTAYTDFGGVTGLNITIEAAT